MGSRRARKPAATTLDTVGRTTNLYCDVRACIPDVFCGSLLAVDPSIGSTSSVVGWAWYKHGVLRKSGVFTAHPENDIPTRLQAVAFQLRLLYDETEPDVLAFEDITPRSFRGGAFSHASLLKALGAILSVSGPTHTIRLAPRVWKRLVSASYRKSDEADAIEMGRIVVDLAQHIQATHPLKPQPKSRKEKTP